MKPSVIRAGLTMMMLAGILIVTATPARADLDAALKPYFSGDYENARTALTPLAEGGDAEAQYWLGNLYDEGKGGAEDDAAAARWYGRAADAGFAAAQYQLAELLRVDSGASQDVRRIMDLYMSAAEQGHLAAYEEIVVCYLEGCGTAKNVPAVKDVAAAFHWSLRAYLQGNASAFHGGMWIWETRQFDTSSLSELEAAILDVVRHPKQSELISHVGALAEAGDARAQVWFGIAHLSHITRNYSEGLRWIRAAAEQGQPFAQFQMAHLLLNGEVTPRDQQSGIKWLMAASDQGFALANARLGDLYAQGDGVPLDYLRAIHLYRRAALLGLRFQAEPALQRIARDPSAWP